MIQDPTAIARSRPPLDAGAAQRTAARFWGIEGVAIALPGDRDRNFRIDSPAGSHVIKFIDQAESEAMTNLLHSAMRAGATLGDALATPQPVPTLDNRPFHYSEAPDGTSWRTAMVSWVHGKPYADFKPHSDGLLKRVGAALAHLDRALASLDSPEAHRHIHWDVAQAGLVVADKHHFIPDEDGRELVRRFMTRMQAHRELLEGLPRQIIHGDANDYNIMLEGRSDPGIGLIDFGDLVHTWRVAEVAVAGAYLAMGHADPVRALGALVAGYHAVLPLSDDELVALPHLVAARLCISVCHSAERAQSEPDDAYQIISQAHAWDLLKVLDGIHPRLITYRVREACALEPCPAGKTLRKWLELAEPAPVLDIPLEGPVFDLSVGTTEFDGMLDPLNAALWTRPFADRMAVSGANLAFGRYLEPRICYRAEQFSRSDHPTGAARQRTIHMGVDLFAQAGTSVCTPFDAEVVAVVDNDMPLDYGPTVILRHHTGSQAFWTLHGHLGRAVVASLKPGDKLKSGEAFAHLGDEAENGGWPPHLHLQVYADDFDSKGNLPGVAWADQQRTWESISPNPELLLRTGLAIEYTEPESEVMRSERAERLASNLSLSYSEPLHIVRGIGAYLFDTAGRAYLDCVNNVCHLGHAHPAPVKAAARQLSVLNTNTRYMHRNILEYSRELAATLPDGLDVCFFVNSGSEANDLALRLARAATGRRGMVVLDGGYHGNLTSLVEISHYKFNGPGGEGAPTHVEVARAPDPYRKPAPAEVLAQDVTRAARDLSTRGFPPAALIAESILSCGGQVVPPEGYLSRAFANARAEGALCIADEVQTGFGRAGRAMWAFELHDVIPDIVTMGKPIGNGFPLGAVVTTRAIANSFANGMEYFNTYGGSPVACAVGLSVLRTIQDEGLQAHAHRVGDYLKERFRGLAHPLIGDVRGEGLFLGIEFVRDQSTLEPADAEASWIVNRMKDLGVLLSTDGPLHNVIKIKPPLAFSMADADQLASKLTLVLQDTCLSP